MTSRRYSDSNRVGILGSIARWCILGSLVLGFVEFEAYMREIVKLWNCRPFDLGLDAAFEDAVEESIDV